MLIECHYFVATIPFMAKHTLVVGASPNPERYAYKAVQMLLNHGHTVEAFGIKKGVVFDVLIQQQMPVSTFDTVTLYVGPGHQPQFYKNIIDLRPQRVIFNPGTENEEFEHLLQQNGIEALRACTLVLLSTGQY